MARPSLKRPERIGQQGRPYLSPESNRQFLREDDLRNATLQAGEWITIFARRADADTALFWGYGPHTDEAASSTTHYADLQADGTGSGNDGDDILADLRVAISDTTGDDIYRREIRDTRSLRAAAAEDRTDQPVFGELQPAAGEAKSIELQAQVVEAQDGVVVANDGSVKIPYGFYSEV